MKKQEEFLNSLLENIGQWTCSICSSNISMPGLFFRNLIRMGYLFEEVSPNRYVKNLYCPKCKTFRSHYKLLSTTPDLSEQKRRVSHSINLNRIRYRILTLLEGKDAFTGISIQSVPEIEYKMPYPNKELSIVVEGMTDEEIRSSFQLLTHEHKLLKNRACDECRKTNTRTPFLGISFWYEGDMNYNGSCIGCGWYDGVKWRDMINSLLSKETSE